MKIVKKILLVLGILIAIVLISAIFIGKDFKVQREIVINKPKQDVFAYVLLLKNQNNFSKWAMMDPNMEKTYTGTDGKVGFIQAWDSKNGDVGKGAQEIKAITDGDRIDYEIRFERPMKITNTAYLVTEAVSPTQTKVKWGFDGKTPYPFNFLCVFMNMEDMVGKDLEVGLKNLIPTPNII